tara:strand:- start:463 stop:804 length:342 start_codon:yes stop_codon:yes gene_type:complete
MSGATFKKKDRNRSRKTYPYLKKTPSFTFTADKEVVIEVGSVNFNGESGPVTYTFTENFTSPPTVTATSIDPDGGNEASVNIFISAVSTSAVSFESSSNFTGTVDFHAIFIGS